MGGCDDLTKTTVKKVGKPAHLILFILNIIWPGLGTILAGVIGESGCHPMTILVGVLQMFTSWLIIGWIWSIWWGYLIY